MHWLLSMQQTNYIINMLTMLLLPAPFTANKTPNLVAGGRGNLFYFFVANRQL